MSEYELNILKKKYSNMKIKTQHKGGKHMFLKN